MRRDNIERSYPYPKNRSKDKEWHECDEDEGTYTSR